MCLILKANGTAATATNGTSAPSATADPAQSNGATSNGSGAVPGQVADYSQWQGYQQQYNNYSNYYKQDAAARNS